MNNVLFIIHPLRVFIPGAIRLTILPLFDVDIKIFFRHRVTFKAFLNINQSW